MSPAKPKPRNKLRGLAIAKGYTTQRDFADALGYKSALIYRIYKGWIFPSPQFQMRASQALGLTLEQFKKLL